MYVVPVCLAFKIKQKKENNDLSEYQTVFGFLSVPQRPWVNKQVSVSDGLPLSNLIFNILIFNPKAVCSLSYRILKK